MESRSFFSLMSGARLIQSRLVSLRAEAEALHNELRANPGDTMAVVLRLNKIHEVILKLDMKVLGKEPVMLAAADNPRFEVFKLFQKYFAKENVDQDRLDGFCAASIEEAGDLKRCMQFQEERRKYRVKVAGLLDDIRREASRFHYEKEMFGYHKESKHFCTDVREYVPREISVLKNKIDKSVYSAGASDAAVFKAFKSIVDFLDAGVRKPANPDGYIEKKDAAGKIMTGSDGKPQYEGVDMHEFYERHYRKLLDLKFECQSVPAPKAVAVGI